MRKGLHDASIAVPMNTMLRDFTGLLAAANDLDNPRQSGIGAYIRPDSTMTQGRTTHDADHTESFPVPFLGEQNSGVRICPDYNER